MQLFDRTQPLWLPAGSVRALLALFVVLAYLVGLASGWPVPPPEIITLVLGFYFGARAAANGPPSPPTMGTA